MDSGTTIKIIAIILFVFGIGLAIWGYQLPDSVGSQISQTVTGSETDKFTVLFISGAVNFVVGTYLLIKN